MSAKSGARPKPGVRADYARFASVPTRWMDNDVYGHVNNVVYYSWFDTAVNRHLIAEGGLRPSESEIIGLCVESGCRYHAPVTFPEPVEVGLRVGHLGTSSVRYELGVFGEGGDARAEGFFVHVFVDRVSRRPLAIPGVLRACLAPLVRPPFAP